MIEYEITARRFNRAYLPYLNDTTQTQIFFGGSSSGKSFFLAQRCIIDVATLGRNYLICRKTARTIKKSLFNELCKAIVAFKMDRLFTINKTDLTFTCINGAQILSAGLDDTEKVKSITPTQGVLTDIWIEEATETEYNDVMQLRKRLRGESASPKRLILSFNPIYQTHWLYKEYFTHYAESPYRRDDLLILKTTYKDNDFLTDQDRYTMENEKDSYFYNVYTLGNWGTLGKTIYTNYKVEHFDTSTFDNIYNGLDFGFASDPTAYIRMHYDKRNKRIYVFDEFMELEMMNDAIATRLHSIIGTEYITCDSAEPKSIRELQTLGIRAKPAKKGKDSINFGIQWIKRHEVIIHPSCVNFIREIQLYQYATDKNGIYIAKPVDKDNHLLDAMRYALEECFTDETAIYF
jgi:phage terminase large subunit